VYLQGCLPGVYLPGISRVYSQGSPRGVSSGVHLPGVYRSGEVWSPGFISQGFISQGCIFQGCIYSGSGVYLQVYLPGLVFPLLCAFSQAYLLCGLSVCHRPCSGFNSRLISGVWPPVRIFRAFSCVASQGLLCFYLLCSGLAPQVDHGRFFQIYLPGLSPEVCIPGHSLGAGASRGVASQGLLARGLFQERPPRSLGVSRVPFSGVRISPVYL
jgi:hypothetical protein